MKKPHVVKETKREIKERSPPPSSNIRAHFWLTHGGMELYKKHLETNKTLELYISKIVEEKIRNHSLKFRDENKEVMGFLLGDVFRYNDKIYAVAKDVATTDLDASMISVRFQRNGFEKLFEQMDSVTFDYIIVGWYHSHPGHHCFMSKTDIKTQKHIFNKEFHSAIVIDPVNKEIEAYKLAGKGYKALSFAVYWDEYQDPYRRVVKKMKRRRE